MRKLATFLLPFLGICALTAIAYGYSLSLSFMLDDFDDLPRAATSSALTILTSSRGYSYYRPVAHLLEKLPYVLQGYYDPVWYHLIPLTLHALSGWLVFLLARRLLATVPAAIAAALFVLYPFSYQVVPWVGAFMHSLTVLVILASLLAYYEARRRASGRWLAASFGAALVAPLVHENGVMAGPMILALEGYLCLERRVPRFSRQSLLLLLPGLAFLAIWRAIPKSSDPWTLDPNSLKENALFFLQGLTYPLAGSLGAVSRWSGQTPQDLAWASLPLVLVVLAAIYWWRRAGAFFLLMLSWFVLTVFPAWLMLSYAYVIDGPRLLYVASVPAALLWAGLWQAAQGSQRLALAGRLAVAVLMGGILWQSWGFLSERGRMFQEGSRLVYQVAEAASPDSGVRTLVVNVPAWFNVKEPEYASGHLGVTFLPDYLGLDRAVFMHRGFNPNVQSLEFREALRPLPYHYGPHGSTVDSAGLVHALHQADDVYLASYGRDGVNLELAGRIRRLETTSLASKAIAELSQKLAILDITASIEGNNVLVELEWLARGSSDRDYTVFVHLYNSSGRLVVQEDGYPLRGLYPIRSWAPGTVVRESRRIALPPGLRPDEYSVVVGVYDRASGERETATDILGRPFPDNAVPAGKIVLGDRSE